MGERSHVPGKVIPLLPPRQAVARPVTPETLATIRASARVSDGRQRRLHDLRISVTDKCNFRCTYCMPKDIFGPGYKFLPQDALLSFEEITRVARIAADLGFELGLGRPDRGRDDVVHP